MRLAPPGLALLPLLVFAQGLAPHLGLKNTQAFAMFSNLQTGGGVTNHFLLPASLQRWDTLRDLVTIRSSSDPVLAKLVGPSWKSFNYFSTYVVDRPRLERRLPPPTWQIPYRALQRRVSELARSGARDVELRYERGGELRALAQAERDADLSGLPGWQAKLLLLRAVPDTRRGYCQW